jgi:hypothetical protein
MRQFSYGLRDLAHRVPRQIIHQCFLLLNRGTYHQAQDQLLNWDIGRKIFLSYLQYIFS